MFNLLFSAYRFFFRYWYQGNMINKNYQYIMKLVLYKTYNNDTSYLDIPNLVQKKIIPWIISFYEIFLVKPYQEITS